MSRIEKAEADIKDLQRLVSQLNTNLSGLATTMDALQKQDRIVSVSKLDDGSGYVVEFSQSGIITIYNGKNGIDGTNGTNGSNGQNGVTPTIGVKLDTDGNYYWTVNGEYLLDESGNKIAATAHVATPQLRINDGNFEISYNGGVTWEIIGEAGNTGAVVFSKVEDGTDAVTFTLGDGTTIVVPKVGAFAINMDTDVIITAGTTVNVSYMVTAADDGTVVDAFGTKGFEAEVMVSSVSAGIVRITAPSPLTRGKVYVIAVKGDGTTTARILSCEEGVFTLDESAFAVKISAAGGTFEVPFQTNLEDPMVMVDPAYGWITYVETKAIRNGTIVFNVAENAGDERSGEVLINFKRYTIIQEGATSTPSTGGGKSDLETLNGGNGSMMFGDYTSTDGWQLNNGIVASSMNWDVITGVTAALVGRFGNAGVLTSPVLTGGCGNLSFSYGSSYMINNGISFKVEIKDKTGTVVKSFPVVNNEATVKTKYEFSEDVSVNGEFSIVITNMCPSGLSGGMPDTFQVLDIVWTGYDISMPSTGGGKSDLETLNSGNGSMMFGDYSTTNGWQLNNGIVASSMNWDAITGVTAALVGRSGSAGTLTSPILSGGCGKLSFTYGSSYMINNGISFKVEIKDEGGAIIKTIPVVNESASVKTKYEFAEDINIAGKFSIVITNMCPSGMAAGMPDTFQVLDIAWTGYTL